MQINLTSVAFQMSTYRIKLDKHLLNLVSDLYPDFSYITICVCLFQPLLCTSNLFCFYCPPPLFLSLVCTHCAPPFCSFSWSLSVFLHITGCCHSSGSTHFLSDDNICPDIYFSNTRLGIETLSSVKCQVQ